MATPAELDAALEALTPHSDLSEITASLPDAEGKSAYRIDGKKTAAWAIEKYAAYLHRQTENDEVAADRIGAIMSEVQPRIDVITEWQHTENAKLQAGIDYFAGLLQTWHMDELAADPKAKTISLPAGKLVARKSPDTVTFPDPQAFINWAKTAHPTWVRTKEEPVKTDVKGGLTRKDDLLIDENGEIVPGVELVEGEVTWKAVTE